MQRRQQHLHGREIAGVTRAVDLDDEAGHPRQIARALLDELHAGKLRQGDGVRNGHVGAGPGIEIERDGQIGLARDRLEIGDEIGLRGRPGERAHRRQQLHRGGAAILRKMRELDRGPEGRMGDTHHDRDAPADKIDGVLDQGLALFEAEIGVFLGFDPGGDNHGGAAVLDDVVDLTAKRGRVDLEVGREGRERRDDQSGIHHVILTPSRLIPLPPVLSTHAYCSGPTPINIPPVRALLAKLARGALISRPSSILCVAYRTLCHLARTCDEELCDGTDRAFFQRDDPNRPPCRR